MKVRCFHLTELVIGRSIQLEKNRRLILITFIDGKCVFVLLHSILKTTLNIFILL